MQKLNWKERKPIIEQLIVDFQNGHGEQPPAEFCRSLRALIDVETNVLCTNLLIKLVGVMVQRTSSLKYARSLF